MPLSMNRSPRGCGSLLRFFSLFRGVAADDRFHGLYLPPHAGRQIDTEGFRHQRQVVGDQHQRHILLLLQLQQQFDNLRLNGHVQRGGRFIGNQ